MITICEAKNEEQETNKQKTEQKTNDDTYVRVPQLKPALLYSRVRKCTASVQPVYDVSSPYIAFPAGETASSARRYLPAEAQARAQAQAVKAAFISALVQLRATGRSGGDHARSGLGEIKMIISINLSQCLHDCTASEHQRILRGNQHLHPSYHHINTSYNTLPRLRFFHSASMTSTIANSLINARSSTSHRLHPT